MTILLLGSEFKILHEYLSARSLQSVDAVRYVQPFLSVIVSEETSGLITEASHRVAVPASRRTHLKPRVTPAPPTPSPPRIPQVALSSIGKFLLYGFIRPTSPNASEAMNRIAEGVTNCRFEATDRSSYEVFDGWHL